MSADRQVDEHLRRRALDALGALGDALAREALETCEVAVEHDVVAWEGTRGTMHGHRVTVVVDPSLRERIMKSHASLDGLAAALAAAMAEREGQAVTDVRVEPGAPASLSTPYRGRV